MSPEDKLAVEECLVLWKYLAQSGERSKRRAIQKLNREGKLGKASYGDADCPLCEQFNCSNCPWKDIPNSIGEKTTCMTQGSPFLSWSGKNRIATQKAASAVYKFLKQIKV